MVGRRPAWCLWNTDLRLFLKVLWRERKTFLNSYTPAVSWRRSTVLASLYNKERGWQFICKRPHHPLSGGCGLFITPRPTAAWVGSGTRRAQKPPCCHPGQQHRKESGTEGSRLLGGKGGNVLIPGAGADAESRSGGQSSVWSQVWVHLSRRRLWERNWRGLWKSFQVVTIVVSSGSVAPRFISLPVTPFASPSQNRPSYKWPQSTYLSHFENCQWWAKK